MKVVGAAERQFQRLQRWVLQGVEDSKLETDVVTGLGWRIGDELEVRIEEKPDPKQIESSDYAVHAHVMSIERKPDQVHLLLSAGGVLSELTTLPHSMPELNQHSVIFLLFCKPRPPESSTIGSKKTKPK